MPDGSEEQKDLSMGSGRSRGQSDGAVGARSGISVSSSVQKGGIGWFVSYIMDFQFYDPWMCMCVIPTSAA